MASVNCLIRKFELDGTYFYYKLFWSGSFATKKITFGHFITYSHLHSSFPPTSPTLQDAGVYVITDLTVETRPCEKEGESCKRLNAWLFEAVKLHVTQGVLAAYTMKLLRLEVHGWVVVWDTVELFLLKWSYTNWSSVCTVLSRGQTLPKCFNHDLWTNTLSCQIIHK